MKDLEQPSRQIILEEQNYLVKAFKELKDSIFNVLFVILDKEDNDDDGDDSMLPLVFQSGFDYLQMFAFPFDAAVIIAWNGGQTLNNVSNLFGRFNITSYLPGVSFDTFLILLYLLILVIVLVLIDIIYVSYSFTKKKFKFTWPLIILAQLVPLFVTVLFLPITQTLLAVVKCQTDVDKEYQVMVSFPDIVCWTGWHLFHSATTLLFASLFIFISSIVSLALFEPRMTSKKMTARQNSRGQVIFIMNKIICQLIFSFTPFQQEWIYSFMLFGLSGWLYWTYNMNDPFYNKKVSVFFRVLSSYYFWTNFMLLVSIVLQETGFDGAFIVWISGLPFIGILIAYQKKTDINQLFNSNLSFKSGLDLQKHIRYVLKLIQNKQTDKNSYMLITGYIQKHKQICLEDQCPLKTSIKLFKKPSDINQMDYKLLKKIEKMYKSGIKKFPYCTQLRLSYAFFNLERINNRNKAYEQYSAALDFNPKFQQQFIIYRFKKIIRENLQNNKDDNTDLIQLIRFDNHILLCEQAMILSANLHKQFWTQLKQQTPNLSKLNKTGSQITKASYAVKQNYEQIYKINSSVPQVLYSYAMYLILVIRNNKQGNQLLQFSKKIYVDKSSKIDQNYQQLSAIQKNRNNSLKNEYPTIEISAKSHSYGKINNINTMFTELTGFKKDQLLDRPLQKLLPEIFINIHHENMVVFKKQDHLQKTTDYLNRLNTGYIRLKSGYIIPIDYQVVYKPAFQRFYATFYTQQNSATKRICHIIINQDGQIIDISRLCSEYFGIQKKNLIQNKENINKLGIDSISKLHKQMNQILQKGQQFLQKQLIFIDGEMYSSQIKIQAVKMKQNNQQQQQKLLEQQQQRLFFNQKQQQYKIIGYYLQIQNKTYEKPTTELPEQYFQQKILTKVKKVDKSFQKNISSLSAQSNLSGQSHYNTNTVTNTITNTRQKQGFNTIIANKVLNLYSQPNQFQLMIREIIQQKTKNQTIQLFKLKTRIKTMRLINNQVKMAYDKDIYNDQYKNNSIDGYDDQEESDYIKLSDQNYHAKIRIAINTDLNHKEVFHLKVGVILLFIFLILFNVLCMLEFVQIYQNGIKQSQNYFDVITTYKDLSKYMTATIYNTNYQQLYQQILNYQLPLNSTEQIYITTFDNKNTQKRIPDAIRYQISNLANYFMLKAYNTDNINDKTQQQFLDNININYINNIYPALAKSQLKYLKNNVANLQTFLKIIFKFFPGLILPLILFQIFWIYTRLKIDEKKMNILLWFLDIPISYIGSLKQNCDKYLKQFLSVKQIMKKGLNNQQDQNTIYSNNTENILKNNDTVQEQQKARRSLIHKQRKKNLLSNLNISYLKMLWIILFGLLFWIIGASVCLSYQFMIDYLILPYQKIGKQITYSNIIVMSASWQVYNPKYMTEQLQIYTEQAEDNYKNYIDIGDRQFHSKQVVSSSHQAVNLAVRNYSTVLLSDICDYLNQGQNSDCRNFVGSSLTGSYRTYSMHIIDKLDEQPPKQTEQWKIANEKYVTQAFYRIVQIWNQLFISESQLAISLTQTTLFVYIFVGMLLVTICWILYLIKINQQINQSIKMLNMIPFKLLSQSRKETRQFIVWLIRQANVKIHEDQ